ncbi:DUF2184 domain-containing protein [Paenilisteria newyorkensis]|uniref:DUF2184 domain-containing protein n=1 Tax=Listeria newyorkensis TaxID=1497681 RepID=UPI000669E5DF|nr:encapsulin [Listeria newyorkensis]KMT62661.1 hypothetical protein X559_0944 [Listeria newyorkensis]
MSSSQVTARLQARDLEVIDKTLFEPREEELTARTIFDMKTDIDPGAETYGYDVATRSGAAKIIANGANDLPLVDTDVKRYFAQIYTIALGFRYSLQDLRQSQMTGKPVDATKAAAVRRGIAEKENSLAWKGDPRYEIQGVATATGIQIEAVGTNAAGTSTKWVDKASDEIVEELRKLRTRITVLPGYGDASLILALPPIQFEELNRRYSDYDARTIMQVVASNGWFSKIKRVADLKGIGLSKSDSLIICHSEPETVQLLLPMDITRQQEEYQYPNWKVPCEERFGGAVVRAPHAILRADGI